MTDSLRTLAERPDFEHWATWMAQMDAKHPEMHEQDFLITFPEAKRAVSYVQGLESRLSDAEDRLKKAREALEEITKEYDETIDGPYPTTCWCGEKARQTLAEMGEK